MVTYVIVLLVRAGADTHYWRWLLELLEQLGEYGMSSDDSGSSGRDDGYEDVYRVKILPWRHPDIASHMEMINVNRYRLKDVEIHADDELIRANPTVENTNIPTVRRGFAAQGAKPIQRDRLDANHDEALFSTRPPPHLGWEKVLYNEEWLHGHPNENITFAVSREAFQWIDWHVTLPPRWVRVRQQRNAEQMDQS